MSAYRLLLTEKDIEAIAFVGNRYSWSDALSGFKVGENELTEPDAWMLLEAFESDIEGGHSPFPMLDSRSELYERLTTLWQAIV